MISVRDKEWVGSPTPKQLGIDERPLQVKRQPVPAPLPEYLIHCSQGVVRQNGNQAAIGDIVLTTSGLHYIPYATVDLMGRIGGLAGAMFTGIAGGVAVAVQDRDKINSARERAAEERQRSYGLRLDERWSVNQSRSHLFVPRTSICGVTMQKGTISLELRDGQSVPIVGLAASAEAEKLLLDYISGKDHSVPIGSKSDVYGLGLPYPVPVRFLQHIVSSEIPEDASAVHLMANNRRWIESVFALITEKRKEDRKIACEKVREHANPVAQVLVKKLSQDGKKGTIVLSVIIIFWLSLIIAIDLHEGFPDGDKYTFGDFVAGHLLFGGVIAAISCLAYLGRRKSRWMRTWLTGP